MADSDQAGGCGCTGDSVRAEKDPAYRRALWIVVLLNLGFGACEIVGGFIADSQALKADALDFIGDGTITLVGLIALGWPEADLMGGLGIAALLINVASAFVLSRFREGDANVRAVWLFSRNDALANIAVIVAAALVAWTGSAWPDLTVAAVIAMLFLHSAYEILRGARTELRELALAT